MYEPTKTRTQKLFKIKDLLLASSTVALDTIGMIAKIGPLQEVNSMGGSIREIILFDDSWAMVKLVVRSNSNVYDCGNYEQYQILSVTNAVVVKRKNYVTLLTNPETELKILHNTPEAIVLNQWYFDNSSDLTTKGFNLFLNLSRDSSLLQETPNGGTKSPGSSNSTFNIREKKDDALDIKQEKSKQKFKNKSLNSSSSSSNEEPPTKIKCLEPFINLTSEQKFNQEVSDQKNQDLIESSKIPPVQIIALEENNPSSAKNSSLVEQNLIATIDNLREPLVCGNNTINFDNHDETKKLMVDKFLTKEADNRLNQKNDKKQTKNVSILKSGPKKEETEQDETKVADDSSEKDVEEDNFKSLMDFQLFSDKHEWDINQDKVLMNFVLKNPGLDLKCDSTYKSLLKEKPHIFGRITSVMLKDRVEELGNIQNYFHLMLVCGGKNVKSEKEKNIFIKSVEQVRRLMCFTPKDD